MLTAYVRTVGQFNRNVCLLLASIGLVAFAVAGGVHAVLVNLFLLRLGYGLDLIGLYNGVGGLGFALCSLPAALACRRWGSRPGLVAGMALIAVGASVLPLIESVPPDWRTRVLLLSRAPTSLGFALYIVGTNPFLMGVTSRQERTHVFAVQAALWPLAGFAGSLIGGFLPRLSAAFQGTSLDSPAAFRYPLLFAAVLLIPAVLSLVLTREPEGAPVREATPDAAPAPVGPIAVLALVVLLQTYCMGVVQVFFNVHLDADLGVSPALIGTLFGAGQLAGGAAALATPLLSARWGHLRVIVWGSLGAVLSLLPLALSAHWATAGIGFVTLTALASLRVPALLVYQQEMVPRRWQALTSGAANMASGLSFSAASLSGGYLIPILGYPVLCGLAAGLLVVGTVIFWAYFRIPRGEYARAEIADAA